MSESDKPDRGQFEDIERWARENRRAEPQPEPAAPRVQNRDEVICPACTHQFRAIPENVQAELYQLQAESIRASLAAPTVVEPVPELLREHFKPRIDFYADKHPALLVRQLATELRWFYATPPRAPTVVEPRTDGMPSNADERYLRRLLAHQVCVPQAYYDDGEAHGTEHGIQIDFMRESVADIDAKLRALGVARYAATPPRAPTMVEPCGWAQLGTLNGRLYLREVYDRSPYPPPADIVRNMNLVPVFAATPPRAALTDEQLDAIFLEQWGTQSGHSPLAFRVYARAVLAASEGGK